LAGGMAVASGLNATWVSTMDKYRITMGLELSLTLIASQGIMHLMDHRLCQREKQIIKREIGAEMVCICVSVKCHSEEVCNIVFLHPLTLVLHSRIYFRPNATLFSFVLIIKTLGFKS
jgi:hypothetical protein